MKTQLLLLRDAIVADTQAVRYACGLSRSCLMAALVTELLELHSLIGKMNLSDTDTAPQPNQLLEVIDEVADAVDACTNNHALMTSNRRPQSDQSECELFCPGFRYSALSYHDASAQQSEQRLYRTLLDTLQMPLADLSAIEQCPFPMCELAVRLAQEVRTMGQKSAQRRLAALAYSRQRFYADEHDPELAQYIQRTIEAGFMTPSGQWEANVTRSQIAYWTSLAAKRLHMAQQWKWAYDRWGIDKLAQDQNKNLLGQHIPHKAVIERIFAKSQ